MDDRDFFGRLAARRDATAFAIRDALVRHVPSYGAQPTAQRTVLLREVHETWSPILHRAPLDEPLNAEDLAVYRALARTRAVHAFPFAEFRSGFEVAHTAGLRECLALAEPGDAVHPVAFTTWGVRELPRVLDAVTGSYLEVCEQKGRRAAARELLMEALLEGRLPTAVPPPRAGHLVLLVRPRHRDTGRSGRQEAVERVLRETEGLVWRGGPVEGELLVLMDVADEVASVRTTAAELTAALAGAWHSSRTLPRRMREPPRRCPRPSTTPGAPWRWSPPRLTQETVPTGRRNCSWSWPSPGTRTRDSGSPDCSIRCGTARICDAHSRSSSTATWTGGAPHRHSICTGGRSPTACSASGG